MIRKAKSIYGINSTSRLVDENLEAKRKAEVLSSSLFNPKSCLLCEMQFTFDSNLPRILVQCGHSICSFCVKELIANDELRCPFCQTIIRGITNIDMLPVNQQIFFTLQKAKDDKIAKPNERYAQTDLAEDKEFKTCEIHRTKLKRFYCVNHELKMCQKCAIHHKGNRACEIKDLCGHGKTHTSFNI